jgi:hypothetical protein
MRTFLPVPILCLLLSARILQAGDTSSKPPWEEPREISRFHLLLERSPFSLPTAEESSPLADRFSMTGIVTIDGQEQIFVFDKTDQSRDLVTRTPNGKNISLVELIREGGIPVKASIRVGGETGTIGFMESSQPRGPEPRGFGAPPGSPAAANNPAQGPQAPITMPALPPLPQQPTVNPPSRRIIRRPVITAPQQPHP